MRRKTTILIVAALELVVIGALVLTRVVVWHDQGWTGFTFYGERSNEEKLPDLPMFGSSGKVYVVTPGSPAGLAGVTTEDRVVAVNGIPIDKTDDLKRLSDEVRRGDVLTYTFERQGEERALDLELENPLISPYQLAALLTNLVAGLIWLGISLLVYWSRPDSRVAGVFFALCASGAAAYLLWAGGELDYPGLRGILPVGSEPAQFIFIALTAIASIIMTNLVLHLALIFPKPRPAAARWPSVFTWIHVLPFAGVLGYGAGVLFLFLAKKPLGVVGAEVFALPILILLTVALKRRIQRSGLWPAVVSSPFLCLALGIAVTTQAAMLVRLLPKPLLAIVVAFLFLAAALSLVVVMTAYAVLSAVALYRSYRESGVELRLQIRWPLWGTFTSLVVSIVLSVIALSSGVFGSGISEQTYIVQTATALASKFIYLLIPVSFAFAILKYRLLDIDVIIRKTFVYTAVTGVVVAVYLVLAGVSGLALVQSIGLESQVATIAATLAVVALFVPVRNLSQKIVDRRFFRRERDLEDTAQRIAEELGGGADLAEGLGATLEAVQRALRTGGLAILVRPPGGKRLVVEAALGLSEAALADFSPDGDDPVLDAARLVEGTEAEGALGTLTRAARSRLAVIGRHDGRTGALMLVRRPQGRARYDEEERSFLIAVADHIAAAVGRSRRREAEGELEKARVMQRSLLPHTLPEVEGLAVAARWEPAREVSGDYYDVIRLDDRRLLVCIGDVVGKGLAAALLMSTLQAAVKAVAAATDSPSDLCEQVRSVVRGSLTGGTFVTFYCAVVDREAMTVASTNAGHNPPILVRGRGEAVRLECGGPAMARILAEGYNHEVTALEKGDRLVLFTDGVTEAMSPAGDLFGDEALVSLVAEFSGASVEEAERGIAATVVAHARGVLSDDLTLVIVGVE